MPRLVFRAALLASVTLAGVTLAGVTLVGCASPRRPGSQSQPSPADAISQFADISTFYRRIGRLAGTDPLPFVGTVAFAAAPNDSVIAILGLSLESRALAFQREGNAFVARYRVTLSFQREGTRPVDLSREEIVRVSSFQETLRTDESVLFQQTLRLTPGTYKVSVTVRDVGSTSESRAAGEYTAPSFGNGTATAPILAYQTTGRGSLTDPLTLVLNSRGAMAYGADTLLAYVEGYGFPGPTTLPFEVRDERQTVVVRDSLRFRGGQPVESQVIRIAPDSVALGEIRLVVGQGTAQRTTSALVSFSQAWVVTNFDQVFELLRYFGHEKDLKALRDAPPPQRARLWREFYRKTDPNAATPDNEALNEYFSRLATANRLYRDEGIPGWKTDRGEVFITLGPPDETAESGPSTSGRVVRWSYLLYRLTLYFQDETGFGRLRLVPGSRAEFERAARQVRREGA